MIGEGCGGDGLTDSLVGGVCSSYLGAQILGLYSPGIDSTLLLASHLTLASFLISRSFRFLISKMRIIISIVQENEDK